MSVFPPRAGITTAVSASLLASTALPTPALAQDGDSGAMRQSEPVVVEATRIPTELDKTGAAVTVIDEGEIERKQDRTVLDALQRVPGLNITQQGAFGGQASVFIRGADSDQTLVLIDGVEVNDPSSPAGSFDFAGLTASNIEKIEVLRGPQSTLYGSDAIGGVISITTKSGRKGFAAEGFLEGGVYDTVRGSGTVRGGTDSATGSLTLRGSRSNGISQQDTNDERDGFRDLNASGKGSLNVTDRLNLDASFRVMDQESEFDFAGNERGGAPQVDDDEQDDQEISGRLQATHTALDGRLENELAFKILDRERENDGAGGRTFESDAQRKTLAYQGTVDVSERVVVSFGAEREENEITTQSFIFGGNRTDGSLNTTSGFGLLQITPIDRLTLSGGVRHDASERFENATTGRVSGSYRLAATGTTLRGVWGQGFKAPTPIELFGQFGNPGLDPEESRSWEVGLDQTIVPNRLSAQVTYFDQETEDLIVFQSQFDNQGNFIGGTNMNVEEAEQRGVELGIDAQPTAWATVAANYTFLDAENTTTGQDLVRRPEHRVNVDLELQPTDRISLGSTLTFQGESRDAGQTLDEFARLNLRGSYQAHANVTVYARVQNALDVDYQTAAGFQQPGANGFAGVRVNF